jgi:hypothetical protein
MSVIEFSVIREGENVIVNFVASRAYEKELRELVGSVLHYFRDYEKREQYMLTWVTVTVTFKGYDVNEVLQVIYATAWAKGIMVKKVITV